MRRQRVRQEPVTERVDPPHGPSGGPDGELSASMRYLAQRYTMPYKECKATLTDIGSEVAKCSSLPPFFLLGFPGSSANI